MKKILLTVLFFLPWIAVANQATPSARPPKLVVNIVVGAMRAGDLERYGAQFGEGGFRRLERGGVRFEAGDYDCQKTSTPVSLATLATGAMPSTHGLVSLHWNDYVDNRNIPLIDDRTVRDVEYHNGNGCYSPRQLIAPTLSDALVEQSPESRAVTIALNPCSAIALGGREGMVFWMDAASCNFSSSTWYMPLLPAWVKKFNADKFYHSYTVTPWRTLHTEEKYINRRRADILPTNSSDRRRVRATEEAIQRIPSMAPHKTAFDKLCYAPAGNALVLEFAKMAVTQLSLGRRAQTDLLNICLDASSAVLEAYGPESIEAEDMYYRLDQSLADFLSFLQAQVRHDEIVIVLTAAHGTSPSYDVGREAGERFNTGQFKVIVNGFLSARYGQGNWVLQYEEKGLYLNHNLLYEKGLSLAQVQDEAASFAMQFRGVAHAVPATALRNGGFADGYGRKMQHSFYPRRSGDIAIDLMPGWIEEHAHKRSSAGSGYAYDVRVPLIFYGAGIAPERIERAVSMTGVTPTLARIMGIEEPFACEGKELEIW